MEVEALIVGLRNISRGVSYNGTADWREDAVAAISLIQRQAERIEALEAERRWIPVSERLPITTGVYECAVQRVADGKLYPETLIYGRYEAHHEDPPETLRPGEFWVEDDGCVVGTGFYNMTEQYGWTYDYATEVFGTTERTSNGIVVYWREIQMPSPNTTSEVNRG